VRGGGGPEVTTEPHDEKGHGRGRTGIRPVETKVSRGRESQSQRVEGGSRAGGRRSPGVGARRFGIVHMYAGDESHSPQEDTSSGDLG
jgi:hypothetical protein